MSHCYVKNWYIATKKIDAITEDLREKLLSMGARFIDEKVSIHAHFYIPEMVYSKVGDIFDKAGFSISDEHPAPCSVTNLEFEVFEKRVPIIEGREAGLIGELAENGVYMSGGAGKPHIHILIPSAEREAILVLLSENNYTKKEVSSFREATHAA